ncbi:uncharacterized protein LOC108732347 [Agrilus planipennis]|uniref:Uncharacterized protein LOC108732347 n=1 Tax=Agrilus planipennis TaxID=224129 RepID=A0A1W4WER7_AGRPL|nr:uncharacterized protein LOC108732347 [Agrilus planipennis]
MAKLLSAVIVVFSVGNLCSTIYVPGQNPNKKALTTLGIKTLGWQDPEKHNNLLIHHNYSKVLNQNENDNEHTTHNIITYKQLPRILSWAMLKNITTTTSYNDDSGDTTEEYRPQQTRNPEFRTKGFRPYHQKTHFPPKRGDHNDDNDDENGTTELSPSEDYSETIENESESTFDQKVSDVEDTEFTTTIRSPSQHLLPPKFTNRKSKQFHSFITSSHRHTEVTTELTYSNFPSTRYGYVPSNSNRWIPIHSQTKPSCYNGDCGSDSNEEVLRPQCVRNCGIPEKIQVVMEAENQNQHVSNTFEKELKKEVIPPGEEDELHVSGTSIYETTIKKAPVPYNKCPKMASGQFVYALSCNQFLNCWKGRGFVQNCAPGTMFNPMTLECDFAHKVKCISGPRTTEMLENNRKSKSEKLEITCPPDFNGFIPHHTDCSKFINCVNGSEDIRDCPPGTLYSTKINNCDHPHNANCAHWTKGPHHSHNGHHSHHNLKPLGYRRPYIYTTQFRLPQTVIKAYCNKYPCESQDGHHSTSVSHNNNTPFGYREIRTEGNDQLRTNRSNQLSSNEWIGYPPTHQIHSNPKCPEGAVGVHPHPFDCSKFLNCANGQTFVQDCGPGTLFNPVIKVCDYPYNVHCVSHEQKAGEPQPTDKSTYLTKPASSQNWQEVVNAEDWRDTSSTSLPIHRAHQFPQQNYYYTTYGGRNPRPQANPLRVHQQLPEQQNTYYYHLGSTPHSYGISRELQPPFPEHNVALKPAFPKYTINRELQLPTVDSTIRGSTEAGFTIHRELQPPIEDSSTQHNFRPVSPQYTIKQELQPPFEDSNTQRPLQPLYPHYTPNQQLQPPVHHSSTGQNIQSVYRSYTIDRELQPPFRDFSANRNSHPVTPGYTIHQELQPPYEDYSTHRSSQTPKSVYSINQELQPPFLESTSEGSPDGYESNTDNNFQGQIEEEEEDMASSQKHDWRIPPSSTVSSRKHLRPLPLDGRRRNGSCSLKSFWCADEEECVPSSMVCDGSKDCSDGSDEINCERYLEKYAMTPNAKLGVHPKEKFPNISLPNCAKLCTEMEGFVCRSFCYRYDFQNLENPEV